MPPKDIASMTPIQAQALESFASMLHRARQVASQVNGQVVNPAERGAWQTIPEPYRRTYRDMAGGILADETALLSILGDFNHAAPPPVPAEPPPPVQGRKKKAGDVEPED